MLIKATHLWPLADIEGTNAKQYTEITSSHNKIVGYSPPMQLGLKEESDSYVLGRGL